MLPRILSLGLAAAGAVVIAADMDCTRAMLEQVVDRYISAQSTGRVEWLNKVLGANVTYLENDKAIPLDAKNNLLRRSLRIDRTHTIYDVVQCATFTELIASNPADPWIIGTQIRLSKEKDGLRVSKIDRIVTTTDDWMFNATRMLHYALLEDWAEIPLERRDTRATLQAAGDAYFDHLGNHSLPVPWGFPCTRLEGGSFTGKGLANDTCNIDIPENTTMQAPNRRYVIDETVGALSMFLQFGGIDNAPDSHQFRVEAGKLRRVHTMTFCAKKPNCGIERPKDDEDPGY